MAKKKKPSYATLERTVRRLKKIPSPQRVKDLLKQRESLYKTITNLQIQLDQYRFQTLE